MPSDPVRDRDRRRAAQRLTMYRRPKPGDSAELVRRAPLMAAMIDSVNASLSLFRAEAHELVTMHARVCRIATSPALTRRQAAAASAVADHLFCALQDLSRAAETAARYTDGAAVQGELS